jgi:hypothetical protein
MPEINAYFGDMKDNYPFRPLTGPLQGIMDKVGGTPCCVQLSHSLNLAGITIGPNSFRRPNQTATFPGPNGGSATYNYLLCVDELEDYLKTNFVAGTDIGHDASGKALSEDDIKSSMQGRYGIMMFRDPTYGYHVELWDGGQILQRDMNEHALFSQPRILFWDVEAFKP